MTPGTAQNDNYPAWKGNWTTDTGCHTSSLLYINKTKLDTGFANPKVQNSEVLAASVVDLFLEAKHQSKSLE